MSRGPVREALRILEKDSVVRILPNRGAHVTQLSVKEVSDIFEVRRTLFGAMIGRLTAEEASALAATLGGDIRTRCAGTGSRRRPSLLRDYVSPQPHCARGLQQRSHERDPGFFGTPDVAV